MLKSSALEQGLAFTALDDSSRAWNCDDLATPPSIVVTVSI